MSTILETRGLTHVYGAGTPFERVALDHVDLKIEKGEILGVIGHTGSGKSTLIQHLNGLLQPSEGEVLLDGKSIWDAKGKCSRETRFRVGLVFQYPEYQLFEETIAKDIAYGPTNMKLPQAEIDERVRESMAAVGLAPELADQSPFALSGGQKRRVAIAGVIAMRPDVLVLDEPTAGLDPAGRDEIFELVRSYHKQSGATILIVSHSMEDIAQIADRLLVMNHAKVLFCDTPREVFSHADEIIAAARGQIREHFRCERTGQQPSCGKHAQENHALRQRDGADGLAERRREDHRSEEVQHGLCKQQIRIARDALSQRAVPAKARAAEQRNRRDVKLHINIIPAEVHGFDQPMKKPACPILKVQQVPDGKPHQNRQHDRCHADRLDNRIDTDSDRTHAEQRRQMLFQAVRQNLPQCGTDHTAGQHRDTVDNYSDWHRISFFLFPLLLCFPFYRRKASLASKRKPHSRSCAV